MGTGQGLGIAVGGCPDQQLGGNVHDEEAVGGRVGGHKPWVGRSCAVWQKCAGQAMGRCASLWLQAYGPVGAAGAGAEGGLVGVAGGFEDDAVAGIVGEFGAGDPGVEDVPGLLEGGAEEGGRDGEAEVGEGGEGDGFEGGGGGLAVGGEVEAGAGGRFAAEGGSGGGLFAVVGPEFAVDFEDAGAVDGLGDGSDEAGQRQSAGAAAGPSGGETAALVAEGEGAAVDLGLGDDHRRGEGGVPVGQLVEVGAGVEAEERGATAGHLEFGSVGSAVAQLGEPAVELGVAHQGRASAVGGVGVADDGAEAGDGGHKR